MKLELNKLYLYAMVINLSKKHNVQSLLYYDK